MVFEVTQEKMNTFGQILFLNSLKHLFHINWMVNGDLILNALLHSVKEFNRNKVITLALLYFLSLPALDSHSFVQTETQQPFNSDLQ